MEAQHTQSLSVAVLQTGESTATDSYYYLTDYLDQILTQNALVRDSKTWDILSSYNMKSTLYGGRTVIFTILSPCLLASSQLSLQFRG